MKWECHCSRGSVVLGLLQFTDSGDDDDDVVFGDEVCVCSDCCPLLGIKAGVKCNCGNGGLAIGVVYY